MLVLKISQHGIRVVFEYTPGNDFVAQMWAPSPHTVEYIGTPFVLLDECFFPEAVKPDMVDRWAVSTGKLNVQSTPKQSNDTAYRSYCYH